MAPDITQEIFNRFVAGTATPAEAAAVRAWLAQPRHELLAQHWMHQHWEALAGGSATALPDGPDYEALLNHLHTRLGWGPAAQPGAPVPGRAWYRWAAAAAVGGLLAGGSWLLRPHPVRPAAPVAVATPYGQQRVLHLPDGSQVTLNGHSTLRYAAADWAKPGHPREVWLDGEAFFSVRHRPDNQRFVVHTQAGFKVEVLGTQFTVYRRRAQARVVLLSGQVRIDFEDHRRPAVVMRPGELVETRDAEPLAPAAPRPVHTAPYASWKDAQLVLDGTTIAELATRLQDTYGVEVVVQTPALNRRRVTGTVPVRDLDLLLQALEETFHLKATRQANRITLAE